MRKFIALALVLVTLIGLLSACSDTKTDDSNTTPATEATQPTETKPSTEPTEPPVHGLTCTQFVARVRSFSSKEDLNPPSSPKTEAGEREGETITTFQCINDLVTVSVYEFNGNVEYIMSMCIPSQVMDKLGSDTIAEAALGAYGFAMMPLFSCEPEIDSSWHQERWLNAPDEGNSDIVIRDYTSNKWLYSTMVCGEFATCIAARYCHQCKTNAPNVSFSTNSPLCDNCNNLHSNDNTSGNGGSNPTTPITQAPTQRPTSTPPAQTNALTLDDFLAHLNSLEGGVTNLNQTNIEGLENTISVSCDFYWNYFHLSATVENNIVRRIYVSVLPSALMDSVAFSNLDEAKVAAYGLAVDPLAAINKNWDAQWHSQQLLSAPEKGDAYTSIRNYQQDDWSFSATIGNALVSVSAVNSSTTATPNQPAETTPQATPTQKPTQTPAQKPTQAPCSHTYKDATCAAPKTCTKCGATSGSALPHTWKDATCTEPETCTVCGATDTPALGHNYSAATCITPATCSDCGATSGDVAKHRWKDATCTAPATCTVCKKTSGRARGHIMDGTVCEECNYTDFSAFAGTFSELADVGHECFEAGCMPSKVSLSKDGVLSFTFEGEAYSVTLEQDRSDLDFLPDQVRFYFDSYPNGVADEEEFLSTYITIDKDSMEFTITFYWPFFCFYDEDRDIYIEDLSFDVVGTLDVLPYTE